MHKALHAERALYEVEKLSGIHCFAECAYYPASAVSVYGLQKVRDFKPQPFGYLIVHSAACVVKVGMRRIYYDVVFHGQAGTSLRLVAVGNALQRTEEQRMVGYDKVRARFDGFFNNRLGYIQTQ